MEDQLRELSREHPLPEGFSKPQLFADAVTVADLEVHRVGVLCTAPDGSEITGSAAALERSPLPRAYFELLERAAILDATGQAFPLRDSKGGGLGSHVPYPPAATPGPVGRPARSSGVALHRTWDEASRRAAYELTERDRVLRSWYGELPVVAAPAPSSLALFSTHEWRACSIPDQGEPEVATAAIVGFPLRPEVPLARGFAGAESLPAAMEAAAGEALQNLAFLWGEPLPSEPPRPTPTAMFHLDYYLYPPHHVHLVRWLEGEHQHHDPPVRFRHAACFVDLTPACFGDRLHVAKAIRADARALILGDVSCDPPGLPGSHVHPIP